MPGSTWRRRSSACASAPPLQDSGRLDGDLRVSGPRHALGGHLRMHLDNLRFVELFTTEVANLKGHLDADLDLAGTLDAAVRCTGQAAVDDLAGEMPGLGLKLTQGHVRLSGDEHTGACTSTARCAPARAR